MSVNVSVCVLSLCVCMGVLFVCMCVGHHLKVTTTKCIILLVCVCMFVHVNVCLHRFADNILVVTSQLTWLQFGGRPWGSREL